MGSAMSGGVETLTSTVHGFMKALISAWLLADSPSPKCKSLKPCVANFGATRIQPIVWLELVSISWPATGLRPRNCFFTII